MRFSQWSDTRKCHSAIIDSCSFYSGLDMILLGVGNAIQDWLPCPTEWAILSRAKNENNGSALPHQTCHCKSNCKCCEIIWDTPRFSVVDSKISLDGNSSLFWHANISVPSHHCRNEKREQTSICISRVCIWLYSLSTTIREPNLNSFGTTTVSILPLFSILLFLKNEKLETRIRVLQ